MRLFALDKGDALLYRDNHSEGPKYPFDWSQSGIATLMPSKDNRKLTWFKECIENRYLSQERQGKVLELTQVLREILEGFDSFKIAQVGETRRVLKLGFWSDQEKVSACPFPMSTVEHPGELWNMLLSIKT
jgi:hypothetical protein